MIKCQLINEEIANKNQNNIIKYLKDVLEQNNIKKNDKEIENIYDSMLEYIKNGSANVIGAFKEEKLLGFIWVYERKVNEERRYHINYFIVNSENRKQGIGKKLIEEVYKFAKRDGIKKVELMVTFKNEDAVKFYQKQDFEIERITLCKEI